MKTRIITGIVLFAIVTPFVYFGGYFMAAFTILLLGAGVYEFLNIKKKANQQPIPIYMYVISFVFSLLMVFDIPSISLYAFNYKEGLLNSFGVNTLWLIGLLTTTFTATLFDKKMNVLDSVYIFTTTLYLSLGIKGLLYLRSYDSGLWLFVYVLLVTCFTDIFAYFGGMTCYKILGNEKVHKLNERISPKKTIEGTVIGTLIATISGFIFAFFVFKGSALEYAPWIYVLLSFLISILGQIGDLVLSAIKRHYSVKDYSSLLPGHGGVLDRIDSLLINCMATAIFISILAYII